MLATLASGGVISPLVGGLMVQRFGFSPSFYCFAAIAAVGALLVSLFVPETRTMRRQAP